MVFVLKLNKLVHNFFFQL